MADLATLQTWLTEAESAHHKLITGSSEEEVAHADMRVKYTRSGMQQLTAYIADLKAQIAAAGGVTSERRRALEIDL